ncbi:MAG: hypothetical protein PHQ86_07400 [Dehalococcoidales bacterium]|nr:hypothetical protein [Dehalococcoidales bacterium]
MENNEPEINRESLDFIFEYTRNAPELQLKDVEALDNKVIQILSVASVIIGLIGFVIGKANINVLSLIALLIALLAYIVLAIFAFIHLKSTNFRRSGQADTLWDEFWSDDVKSIKHSLVADISKAYAFNKTLINKKARTLLCVVIFAAVEVVAVGSFIILSAFFTCP